MELLRELILPTEIVLPYDLVPLVPMGRIQPLQRLHLAHRSIPPAATHGSLRARLLLAARDESLPLRPLPTGGGTGARGGGST